MRITFNSVAPASIPLRNRKKLRSFLFSLFKREGFHLDTLSLVFTNDEYLLELNKSFLKHDYYTDILTFDLTETSGFLKGEIYISIDRVRENATSNNVVFKNELSRVIFHGALHLCGWKDKSKHERVEMRQKEDEYLLLFEKV